MRRGRRPPARSRWRSRRPAGVGLDAFHGGLRELRRVVVQHQAADALLQLRLEVEARGAPRCRWRRPSRCRPSGSARCRAAPRTRAPAGHRRPGSIHRAGGRTHWLRPRPSVSGQSTRQPRALRCAASSSMSRPVRAAMPGDDHRRVGRAPLQVVDFIAGAGDVARGGDMVDCLEEEGSRKGAGYFISRPSLPMTVTST